MDRETDPSYSLRVQVEDGGTTPRSVETTYTIVVDDFNDNSPQFASNQTTNIVVNENQAPGEVLLAIRATDADTGMSSSSMCVCVCLPCGSTCQLFQ